MRAWRGGSVVESLHYFCRGPTRVQFPAPVLGGSYLPATPALGDPTLSSELHGYVL